MHSVPAPHFSLKRFSPESLLRKREMAIQELSLHLWNEVYAVVNRMNPSRPMDTDAVDRITLRGDRGVMQRTIQLARAKEGDMADLDMELPQMFAVFDRLMERAQGGRTPTSAEAIDPVDIITKRVLSGEGDFRRMDFDLTPDQVARILEILRASGKPELATVFSTLIAQRDKMIEALERDDKFPCLYNSAHFKLKVEACSPKTGVFLFGDLVDFKSMNDKRYGYDFVDNVILKAVCEALAANFNQDGFASRFGGDEFMVYLPSATNAGAAANRMAQVVAQAMAGIDEQTVQKHFEQIPQQCRDEYWGPASPAAYQAILNNLKGLHMKIGAHKPDERQPYDDIKVVAEENLKLASLKKDEMRFPTVLRTGGAAQPALEL